MNEYDSDKMRDVLEEAHGMAVTDDPASADVLLVNTCSVREKAQEKVFSLLGQWRLLKAERPQLVIGVGGCVASQEGEAITARAPFVDLVFGPQTLHRLPEMIRGRKETGRSQIDISFPEIEKFDHLPRAKAGGAAAFVSIMEGCSKYCSFCVVPYTRGPERYRPAVDIVAEIAGWVDAGVREIVLLGQTVDSYRDPALPPVLGDDPDETQFPHLLRLIAERTPRFNPLHPAAPGLARLRYTSPHPRHATASLARAHAELDLLARHVHLPVQSGSDRMLRRMIRRYTRAEYIERVARLSRSRPGLTLSTDIIVGFPGETADDFEQTLSLVREVGFVSLFGFKFSPRPLTPALKLGDDVPEEEKAERLSRLFALAEEQGRTHLESLVGTRQEVLIEGPSKAKSDVPHFSGRTSRNEIVHVEAPTDRFATGSLVRVDVLRAYKHSLEGRMTPDALASLPRAERRRPEESTRRALPLVTT